MVKFGSEQKLYRIGGCGAKRYDLRQAITNMGALARRYAPSDEQEAGKSSCAIEPGKIQFQMQIFVAGFSSNLSPIYPLQRKLHVVVNIIDLLESSDLRLRLLQGKEKQQNQKRKQWQQEQCAPAPGVYAQRSGPAGEPLVFEGGTTEIPEDFDFFFMDLDFLIIGFPQSGTTSLLNYLRQHPKLRLFHEEDTVFWRGRLSEEEHELWFRENYGTSNTNAIVNVSVVPADAGAAATPVLYGLKDPLLVFSSEVLHFIKFRVRRMRDLKIVFLVREPLGMILSWLHAGTPWLMHWDDPIHLSVGLLHEEIQTALKILTVPELNYVAPPVGGHVAQDAEHKNMDIIDDDRKVFRRCVFALAEYATGEDLATRLLPALEEEERGKGTQHTEHEQALLGRQQDDHQDEVMSDDAPTTAPDVELSLPFDAFFQKVVAEQTNAGWQVDSKLSQYLARTLDHFPVLRLSGERLVDAGLLDGKGILGATRNASMSITITITGGQEEERWIHFAARRDGALPSEPRAASHSAAGAADRRRRRATVREFLEHYEQAFENYVRPGNIYFMSTHKLQKKPQSALQDLLTFLNRKRTSESVPNGAMVDQHENAAGGSTSYNSAAAARMAGEQGQVSTPSKIVELDTAFSFNVRQKHHVKLKRLPLEFDLCESRLLPFLEVLFPEKTRRPLEKLFAEFSDVDRRAGHPPGEDLFPDPDDSSTSGGHPCFSASRRADARRKRRVYEVNKLAAPLWQARELRRVTRMFLQKPASFLKLWSEQWEFTKKLSASRIVSEIASDAQVAYARGDGQPSHDLAPDLRQEWQIPIDPPNMCTLGGDVLKNVLKNYYCEFQAPLSCSKCCLEDDPVCWSEEHRGQSVVFTENVQKVMQSDGGMDVYRKESDERSIAHRLHSCCVVIVNHMIKATTDYLRLEMCGQEIGCSGVPRGCQGPSVVDGRATAVEAGALQFPASYGPAMAVRGGPGAAVIGDLCLSRGPRKRGGERGQMRTFFARATACERVSLVGAVAIGFLLVIEPCAQPVENAADPSLLLL
eukprot:g11107.t1